MLSRERVAAAIKFEQPDVIPLQIYPAVGGLYEHEQKLVDLIKQCGHDFGDLDGLVLPEWKKHLKRGQWERPNGGHSDYK